LTLFYALTACKKNSVDFTYSPSEPRAGQTVQFSNQSYTGEEWNWTFGDGATSMLKSPAHVYKQPGTYQVMLKVDNNNSWTAIHQLTVYDTVPTFVCEDSVFYVYKDYTFTANVYNPYNLEVSYEWALPINTPYAVITDTAMNKSSLHLYFIQPMEAAPIWLRIVMNGKETIVEKTFAVSDKKTNSVLLRTDEADYRQRIFGERAEQPTADASAKALLDAEQDTMQHYNGYLFLLSELQTVFPEMQGFHIASRKIYYRADGLWVANIDGANRVQIDSAPCSAMTLDTKDNRIYWANEEGVWYLPFIGSDNNKFVTEPTLLNQLSGVTEIAADPEQK